MVTSSADDGFIEESLLRAIVDVPADEGARLAYADWLDERADPRSRYLRAELDVFRERSGGDSVVNDLLQQMAIGLDHVWVARISRPPVGVCCDKLRFQYPWGTPPRLEPSAFHVMQNWMTTELPAEYRAFLLNYNGGKPDPGRLGLGDGGVRRVEYLLSIWSPDGQPEDFDEDLVILAESHLVGDPPLRQPGIGIPRDCIKIGYCDLMGEWDTLCLAYTGARRGAVLLVDVPLGPVDGEALFIQLAESFPVFIAMLH